MEDISKYEIERNRLMKYIQTLDLLNLNAAETAMIKCMARVAKDQTGNHKHHLDIDNLVNQALGEDYGY